jgi:Na+-transporting methylmalonyl-CoA/oxaloacetate decarboxylase gamma subunit
MALTERLMTGVNISILGMGLVFLLLALLWGLLTVLLRLDREPSSGDIAEGGRTDRPAAVTPRGMAPELFAAIGVAVLTHQSVLRKRAAPSMRSHWPGSILFASRWVSAGRHQQTQNWHPGKR